MDVSLDDNNFEEIGSNSKNQSFRRDVEDIPQFQNCMDSK